MEKIYEKKNLGIPATLLTFFAFFIGYAMTQSYSTILVGVLFAVLVFTFQFDDQIKAAVKQSYIISFVAVLVYMVMDVFENFVGMILPAGGGFNFIQRAVSKVYTIGNNLISIAVIIVFIIFMIFALLRKDVKIGVVSNVLGEGTPKQKPAPAPQPVPVHNQQPQQPQQYQQPQAQQYQQPTPQPMYQQAPAQPVQAPPVNKCSQCGETNLSEAMFCASCGNKLK